jgi:hypothetical protein
MPYGLEKELDTTENNAWMEKCVAGVMKGNKSMSEGSCIAICKVQLQKNQTKKTKSTTPPPWNLPVVPQASLSDMGDQSLNDTMNQIQSALDNLLAASGQHPYLVDVYQDYCVAGVSGDLFKLDYTMDDSGNVTFSNPIAVDKVITYVPKKQSPAASTAVPQIPSSSTRRMTHGNVTIN